MQALLNRYVTYFKGLVVELYVWARWLRLFLVVGQTLHESVEIIQFRLIQVLTYCLWSCLVLFLLVYILHSIGLWPLTS